MGHGLLFPGSHIPGYGASVKPGAYQSVRDKCLLLGEEIGELFKAVRKVEGLKIDISSQFGTVSEELADVFIYLCAIANRYGIDLETAFREKEKINHQRSWIEQGDLFAGFESQIEGDGA